MANDIPIIDISAYGLGVTDTNAVPQDTLTKLADLVRQAFSEIGFCYIKNHGIPEMVIQKAFNASKQFFDQDDEFKQNFTRRPGDAVGWESIERESLNPERPHGDLKEVFNYFPPCYPQNLPLIEYMHEPLQALFDKCAALSLRMFDLLSLGLNLEDKKFLRNCHTLIGRAGNLTALRTLMYPELSNDRDIKPGQVRCGEHSDYGSLTLLFQDDMGGLEVKRRDGTYVSATPVSGTILVNIGDMMQRWTTDRFIAAKHRVLIPKDERWKNRSRQSMAFFVNADDEVHIKCLDGSKKYEPITCLEYLNQRFSAAYPNEDMTIKL